MGVSVTDRVSVVPTWTTAGLSGLSAASVEGIGLGSDAAWTILSSGFLLRSDLPS